MSERVGRQRWPCTASGSALVVGVALISLMAVPPAFAEDPPGAEIAKAKKHRPGKKKCRRNQVKVRFGKRARCLPLSSALPGPKPGDQRLAIVKEGLTPEIGHIPDPKNRIPPPAEKLYGKFGPKALKGMEKAVGIAVSRLDGNSRAPLRGRWRGERWS